MQRDFLLAYLQIQGDWKFPVPGFWQHRAGLGCKVIKLMILDTDQKGCVPFLTLSSSANG